ncbi:MAG: hypothetical protein ACOY0T_25375 [Myxococcota bacterium]
MKTNWAVKALPASMLALALCLPAGCSSTSDADSCSLKARIDRVTSAADAIVSASTEMRGELYVACAAIAGMPAVNAADATDEKVMAACDAASLKIKGAVTASVSITVVPGRCELDASAQVSCEGSCKADVSCTEPGIDVRCMPGQLSVECSGECTGTLSCEGSASAAVKCEGACNGSCTGTCEGSCEGSCDGTCMGTCDGTASSAACAGKCSGTCTGTCSGSCSATCTGTCKGSCTYEADAMVKCDATARCKGMCSVMGTAPKCEGELKPPMCMGDASCQASCKSEAKVRAECTPPTVVVVGLADATFSATLSKNLPVVLKVLGKAKVVFAGAGEFASASSALIAGVGSDLKCAASHAANLTAKVQAAASAAVSVNVSVMASASVSTSAGTGS